MDTNESPRKQLADKLIAANHVLVTVSRNPSIDQLAACIGLTLLLNKIDKHASAVFSGEVPSVIEFLQPEETIEKTTDSLRDFIIALDKSKADKLRYKVEDNVVRIFITPYRTSIGQEDLNFSQGDFNVDVVIALGVTEQNDLDEAILAHGRILHDATVTTINTSGSSELGSINWTDPHASSLSELVTELSQSISAEDIDGQIATSFLTGIVAETQRFSNEKTSPQTMSVSAALMARGANQQLISIKLEEDRPVPAQVGDEAENSVIPESVTGPEYDSEEVKKTEDGTIEISHVDEEEVEDELLEVSEPEAPVQSTEASTKQFKDEHDTELLTGGSKLITEPPMLGGVLTANTRPESLDPTTDPFSLAGEAEQQILTRDTTAPISQVEVTGEQTEYQSKKTLAEIEQAVNSPHADVNPELSDARDEVLKAFNVVPPTPEPIEALNAQPFGEPLHAEEAQPWTPPQDEAHPEFLDVLQQHIPAVPVVPPVPDLVDAPLPASPIDVIPPLPIDAPTQAPQVIDPNAPPPVPPPIPFDFNNPPKP